MIPITLKSIKCSKDEDIRRLAKFVGIEQAEEMTSIELIQRLKDIGIVESDYDKDGKPLWGTKAWIAAKEHTR